MAAESATAMHNFDLNEDQVLIKETIRKFVQDSLEPAALEHDEHARFVREAWQGLGELGLLGLTLSEESGGAGLGMVAFVLVLEETAAACGSSARVLLDQAGSCCCALEGSDPGAELMAGIAMGEVLAAFVGPAAGIRCAASDGEWTLDGRAGIVTCGDEASVLIVSATDADGVMHLFNVPAQDVTREDAGALGFRACAPAAVSFAGTAVAADALIADGESALVAVTRAEQATWLGGAAMAVGMARRSCEIARAHAAERIAFGKPLLAKQTVVAKLVECGRRVDAARHQVYHAARLVDAEPDAFEAIARSRLSAVEAAIHSGDEAIQILGGYGYTVEYHVERHYRDAQMLAIMDGGGSLLRGGLAARLT